MCGGFSGFWDAFHNESPPIPKVVEISRDSETSSDDDTVSLLSEADVARAFTRYRTTILTYANQRLDTENDDDDQDDDRDLYFLEMEKDETEEKNVKPLGNPVNSDDDDLGSLAWSSFDSRMGDTRVIMMKVTDAKEKYYDRNNFDDGSSYSSYYFRQPPLSTFVTDKAINSWHTTSSRTTQKFRNPPRFNSYESL